jgi:hypothetical protein
MAQASLSQIALEHLLELRQSEPGEIGWEFLGPDLQQKGRHEVQPTTAAHCIEGVWLVPTGPRAMAKPGFQGTDLRLKPVLNGVSLRSCLQRCSE